MAAAAGRTVFHSIGPIYECMGLLDVYLISPFLLINRNQKFDVINRLWPIVFVMEINCKDIPTLLKHKPIYSVQWR